MVEACQNDLKKKTIKRNGHRVEYPGTKIKAFWKWLNKIKKLTTSKGDKKSIDSDISTKEAYKFIEQHWKDARNNVIGKLPSKPYLLNERVEMIEDLVNKLENDIPPSEIGQYPKNIPASFEDILNAGWVFKIKKIYKDKTMNSPEDFAKLNRLILKAIESSFVHEIYGKKLSKIN